MELLFRRKQTAGKLTKVAFKLWSKIEFDQEEQEIVKRYRFGEAVLIETLQPELMRKTALLAAGIFVLAFGLFSSMWGMGVGFFLGLIAAGGFFYWYVNEKRETIFVKDLIHGRDFTCNSVVELARKEAWLGYVVSYLRQVMESAKHWDGTERRTVEPLPKDQALQVILRGL